MSIAAYPTSMNPYLDAELSYRREQLVAAAASVATGRRVRRRSRRATRNTSN